MSKTPTVLLVVLCLTLVFAHSALADEGRASEPMATYEGRQVPLDEVWNQALAVHCHDAGGKGKLTCYDTAVEVDLDLIKRGAAPDAIVEKYTNTQKSGNGESPDGVCYARLWEAINYDTSYRSMVLCYDYNDLRSVHFNDVTSSVESFDPVTIYNPINYGSPTLTTIINLPDLRNFSFNDVTSSVSRRN